MRKDNGIIYICKSDIDKNYSYLQKKGFSNLTRASLKRMFDEYVEKELPYKVYKTGSPYDTTRQRHTIHISLYKFYRYCFKV